jgi:hypothetical protein
MKRYFLLIVFLVIAPWGTAFSATIRYVKPDSDKFAWSGRSPIYVNIQAAIDDASEGDEIWVASGTYFENIILRAGVKLVGEFVGFETSVNDRQLWNQNSDNFIMPKTRIDGSYAGRCIDAKSNTIIDGFELCHGSGKSGCGIHINYETNINIRNVYIHDCGTENNEILQNGTVWGVGISIDADTEDFPNATNYDGTIIIEKSVLWKNIAWCGAIEMFDDSRSKLIIKNCTIVSNDAFGIEIRFNNDENEKILRPYREDHEFFNNISYNQANFRDYAPPIGRALIDGKYDHNLNNNIWAWARQYTRYTYIGDSNWDREPTGWDASSLNQHNIFENDLSSDPKFLNSDSGDFHLLVDSPCQASGENGAQMGAYGNLYEQINLVHNPEFDNGTANWYLLIDSTTASSSFTIANSGGLSGANVGKISIDNSGPDIRDISLSQDFPITAGVTYQISFMAKAASFRSIEMVIEQRLGDHINYWSMPQIKIDTTATLYGPYSFNCTQTDNNTRIIFLLGGSSIDCYLDAVMIFVNKDGNGVNDEREQVSSDIPNLFSLYPNYPNPFPSLGRGTGNSETTIEYNIANGAAVTLIIYNMRGELVNQLQNGYQPAGKYSVRWIGQDNDNRLMPSGIYFLKLQANESIAMRKMILVR